MSNHSVLLITSASLLLLSFLIMTCVVPRWRWIYAIGLVGSVMHLMGVIRWQIFHDSFLFIDLSGVALMGIAGFWSLGRAINKEKRRHA
jgi:hypothetical protein